MKVGLACVSREQPPGWEPVERLPCFGEPIYRRLDAAEEREDAYEDRV